MNTKRKPFPHWKSTFIIEILDRPIPDQWAIDVVEVEKIVKDTTPKHFHHTRLRRTAFDLMALTSLNPERSNPKGRNEGDY